MFKDAFEQVKKYLMTPPLLESPKPGEDLFLLLLQAPIVVGAVLFQEEGKKQHHVHYVSKTLKGVESSTGKAHVCYLDTDKEVGAIFPS